MPGKPSPILILIIVTYLALGFLYAGLTPPWQTPDEPAHYNVARAIAEDRALPELVGGCYDEAYLNRLKSQKFPPHLSLASICYEHYQPPLYYLLAAPIFALSEGSLIALRSFSVILGAIGLIFVHQTISLFAPQPALALGTTAFVAFVPMHLTMLAAANNDGLAELLFILLIYLLLRWLLQERRGEKPLSLWVGVVLGLGLITKVTIYIGLPLVALVLFLADRDLKALLNNGVRVYLPAFIIALPLYIRNSLVYGGLDILGLRRHDEVVVGQLRTAGHLAGVGLGAYLKELARTTFHSFWGQFGWLAVPMDRRVYLALTVVQLLALCGLCLWLWTYFSKSDSSPSATSETAEGFAGYGRRTLALLPNRQAMWVMVATIILAAGVFAGLNVSFVQFQGRYFFPALMPLGFFFSLGLLEAFRQKWALGLALVLVGVVAWLGVSSSLQGGLDKWGVLIGGLALGALLVRRRLPVEDPSWFVAAIYIALAALAATSLWWYIIPNL